MNLLRFPVPPVRCIRLVGAGRGARCQVQLADGTPDESFPPQPSRSNRWDAEVDAERIACATGLPIDDEAVQGRLARRSTYWNARRRSGGVGQKRLSLDEILGMSGGSDAA